LYPAPPVAEFLGHIISILQFVGIAWMIVGGDKLIRMFGYRGPLPAFYWTVQDNPVPLAVFLFLLAPQMIARLQSNGAFEVYLDDGIVFSKLEKGALPTVDDLVNPLKAAGLKYIES
jgi:selT/selW/selH-like putative selenoprotein